MNLGRVQIAALGRALDEARQGARLVYLAGSIPARDQARQAAAEIRASDGAMIEDHAAPTGPVVEIQDFRDAEGVGGWLRIQGVGDGAPILAGQPDRIIADPAAPRAALDAIASGWRAFNDRRRGVA